MSPLVALIFLCHLTYIACANDVSASTHRRLLAGIPPQAVAEKPHNDDEKLKDPVVVNIDTNEAVKKAKPKPEDGKVPEKPHENKSTSTTPKPVNESKVTKDEDHKLVQTTQMESGTLLRGVAVIVALTTLVLIYMALKTYCGSRNKQPVMVRKYGVRTRRSDIEMTPLPLDEDEDDETLFDVNSTHR